MWCFLNLVKADGGVQLEVIKWWTRERYRLGRSLKEGSETLSSRSLIRNAVIMLIEFLMCNRKGVSGGRLFDISVLFA